MASELPTYSTFMLPVLQAVTALGGSGSVREIREKTIDILDASDEELAIVYPTNGRSVLLDRLDWARSYSKLGGLLESPKRGLFLITNEGRDIVSLDEDSARTRLNEVNNTVRAERAARRKTEVTNPDEPEPGDIDEDDEDEATSNAWRDVLLKRLHALSPDAFEEFVLYILRSYGLELERTGGSGDEGIDGIGTAPLSPVLSARVAVQAKRYDPSRAVSREQVALFQRDASAAGAERAVMVSLSRFTEPARQAAIVTTPTVDLIDGDRICDLAREQGHGVRELPVVNESWFDRFEKQ